MNNDKSISSITGKVCPIRGDNIDTDQIIPARYLKSVSFNGMEKGLFYDLRFDKEGRSLDYVIDDERYKGHNIYFVQTNFGCGSSREHAPQAIKRSGVEAIIGVSYSEIFFGNCVSIGVPCFNVSAPKILELIDFAEQNPDTIFKIDIQTLTLHYGDNQCPLEFPAQIQQLFLNGEYDPLDVLLSKKEMILEFEKQLEKY